MAGDKNNKHSNKVFKTALKNSRVVDETMVREMDDIVIDNCDASVRVLNIVQAEMERCHNDPNNIRRFLDLNTYGADYNEEIEACYRNGRVGVVDGTDIIAPMTSRQS